MTIAENESIRRLPLRHPRLRARPGMTLIELVVAVLILSVGLLALAGVAGAVARQIGTGGLHTRAAFVAQARLDSLISVPCTGLAATSVLVGTSSHYMDGVQEKWVVE
ncbi:MAG TPA: prepilin-type N-terminal cleavage/methylation domain-containing protein, partial [Gemmatimonadaceae bacterium]|nr:prepilin-type N-terminal cleavage/methylation domain-containing protein [Gemmatimonadaceae bacterium]